MNTKTKKITCISCPFGCTLELVCQNKELTKISGNKCQRGHIYAKNEFYNPKRMLTSTIKLIDGTIFQLPVRTKEPIPKGKIKEAMLALKTLSTKAPIQTGTVLVPDLVETGVALIATRSVKKSDT